MKTEPAETKPTETKLKENKPMKTKLYRAITLLNGINGEEIRFVSWYKYKTARPGYRYSGIIKNYKSLNPILKKYWAEAMDECFTEKQVTEIGNFLHTATKGEWDVYVYQEFFPDEIKGNEKMRHKLSHVRCSNPGAFETDVWSETIPFRGIIVNNGVPMFDEIEEEYVLQPYDFSSESVSVLNRYRTTSTYTLKKYR